jgi:hypothetical protein
MNKCILVLCIAVGAGYIRPLQGIAAQDAAKPADPASLSGVWQLNLADSEARGRGPAGEPGDAGGGGQPPAGGGGGGNGGGGRGGRGGYGGGGGRGAGGSDMQKARALIQELMTPADRLTITATATEVSVANNTGQVFKYAANGKEEKQKYTNGEVKATTAWDAGVLKQTFDLGNNIKYVQTWALSADGKQLVVTIAPDAAGRRGGRGGGEAFTVQGRGGQGRSGAGGQRGGSAGQGRGPTSNVAPAGQKRSVYDRVAGQ